MAMTPRINCALALFVAIAALTLASLPAAAQPRRVALVVGVDTYAHLSKLEKAVNDARAVAQVLRDDLAFSTVITGENLDRRGMVRKFQELDTAIKLGDLVFFFFAGHGVALGHDNILLPADMPKPGNGEDGLVRREGFPIGAIISDIQARGATTSMLVLDACRDNPFEQAGVRSLGAARGLTLIKAPQGVFVLYSAGYGQKALDRLPGNDTSLTSVFTRHLIPALRTPGLSHVQIAKRVQQEVDAVARQSANHPQQPAYYDQIVGDEVLLPRGNTSVRPDPCKTPGCSPSNVSPEPKKAPTLPRPVAVAPPQVTPSAVAPSKPAQKPSNAQPVAEETKVAKAVAAAKAVSKLHPLPPGTTDVKQTCAREKSGSCSNATAVCVRGCIDRGRHPTCMSECDSAGARCMNTGIWLTTGCQGKGLPRN